MFPTLRSQLFIQYSSTHKLG